MTHSPYLGAYLRFLATQAAGMRITSDVVVSTLVDYCHSNLQFYLELKRRGCELGQELLAEFAGLIHQGDLDHVLWRAAISVLSEEYKFLSGRYPGNIFLKTKEEAVPLIRAIMSYNRPQRPSRLDDARFFCVGSCFATNVANELANAGAKVATTVLAETVNSPRNNLDLFSYFDTGVRRGLVADLELTRELSLEDVRADFLGANTLVLTLGCAYSLLSEAGAPIRKPTAQSRFDKPRIQGIVGCLQEIVGICRRNTYRDIFVTVSPVPLAGTLLHAGNPFISDSASKALLRAAVEELVGTDETVTYIPSFEVFRGLALHAHFPTFGLSDGYSRHADRQIVAWVVREFVKNFYGG